MVFAVALTLLPGHDRTWSSTTSGRWSETPVAGVDTVPTVAGNAGSTSTWSSWIFGVVDG
ncbi:hypothetical protein GCM10009557_94380 [Virgisporangium ochraceum]